MNRGAVSVFGLGPVGLTVSLCLASRGFEVIGFDVDRDKLMVLKKGRVPFYEPGLDELLASSLEKSTFKCTMDYEEAVLATSITFITVGTPSRPDGSIDLSCVEEASRMIGDALAHKDDWHLVVVKSTVLPGTTEGLVRRLMEERSGKKCGPDFGLCANPEFLSEGSAVRDFLNPDRIVIGEHDKRSGDELESLYKSFYGNKMPPVLRTSPANAELIKYASNAFLAVKISFINTIADLCEAIPGADVDVVARGMGLDKRISPLFLRAGAGYGGPCLPKDLDALISFARSRGCEPVLLEAVQEVNKRRPLKIVELARKALGSLRGKRVAVLGLSFKPGTDDVRNAPSLNVIGLLLKEGASVVVYDPMAMPGVRAIFGSKIDYAPSLIDCIRGADCSIVLTEWGEFKNIGFEDFKKYMRTPVVIDGRRIYVNRDVSDEVRYVAIGSCGVR